MNSLCAERTSCPLPSLRPPPILARRRSKVPSVITSIVLLHVDGNRIPETATTLANIDRVTEVYSVTGDWELVAMVRVRTHEEIADVVTGEIAKVDGVTGTHTMIAFRAYASEDLERLWGVGFEEAEGM